MLREVSEEVEFKLRLKCQEGPSCVKTGVRSILGGGNELDVFKVQKEDSIAGSWRSRMGGARQG